MGKSRHAALYLVASNALLWGLPLAINQIQLMGFQHNRATQSTPAPPTGPGMEGLIAAPTVLDPDTVLSVSGEVNSMGSAEPLGLVNTSAPAAPTNSFPWNPSATEDPLAGLVGRPSRASLTLEEQLTRADGLGGVLSIQGPQEPLMPIAARAEKQQLLRLGDPLAALPQHWREPLRRELGQRKTLSNVATVRLPVRAIKERQEVPVIVDEHGQAEGLVSPNSHHVSAAVESWATRQKPAKPGTVQVVVVAVEPLEGDEVPAASTIAAMSSSTKATLPQPPPLPPLPGTSL